MSHIQSVTHERCPREAWCVDIPVVPGTALQTALKQALGWEPVENGGTVGSTQWCKPGIA